MFGHYKALNPACVGETLSSAVNSTVELRDDLLNFSFGSLLSWDLYIFFKYSSLELEISRA